MTCLTATKTLWVRDIQLTPEQNAHLVAYRHIKENQLRASDAKGEILAEQSEAIRLMAALYWGEGAKVRGGFDFSNSDPSMLRLVISWLEENNFQYRMTVYSYLENGVSEAEILDWWESNTGRRPHRI